MKHFLPGCTRWDIGFLIHAYHRFKKHIAEEEKGSCGLHVREIVAATTLGILIAKRTRLGNSILSIGCDIVGQALYQDSAALPVLAARFFVEFLIPRLNFQASLADLKAHMAECMLDDVLQPGCV